MDSTKAISMAIRVRMLRLGVTQRQLAGRVGLSQTTISNLLTGRSGYQLPTLDKLAKGLGWNDATDIAVAAKQEEKSPQ